MTSFKTKRFFDFYADTISHNKTLRDYTCVPCKQAKYSSDAHKKRDSVNLYFKSLVNTQR